MKILEFFKVPTYPDEEDARRVQILYSTQNVILAVAGLLLGLSLIFGHFNTAFNVGVIVIVVLGTRWLVQRGRLKLSSHIFLACLILATSNELAFSQGLHDVTLVLVPLIMILTSLLVDPLGYWLTVISLVIIVEGLVLAEYLGWLVNRASYLTKFTDLITAFVVLSVSSWLVHMLAEHLFRNLTQVREAAARHAKLAEAARRRAEHVEVLNRVSSAITAGLDLGQVLENLYRRVCDVLPADAFYVALYDEASGYLTFPLFYDQGQLLHLDPNDVRERPGFAGEVIRRRGTLYIPDLGAAEILEHYQLVVVGGEDSLSYLGVPLIAQERVIGVMSVQSSQVGAYAEDQIILMEALATQAAIAIQNARLYSQASEALQREQRLNQTLHTISRFLDLEVVLQTATELIAKALDADMALLALISSDGKVFTDIHSYKVPVEISQVSLPYSQGISWEAVLQRKSLRVADYSTSPQALPELKEQGLHAMLVTPILVASGLSGEAGIARPTELAGLPPGEDRPCLGAILVCSLDRQRQFDERDQALMETIASQAGVTIQNARLVTALRQRETILEAATFVAETFLTLPDWRMGIHVVLPRVGQVIGCSQVSLFENIHHPGGPPAAVLRYAYLTERRENDGWLVPAQLEPGHPYAHELPLVRPGWERWYRRMNRGEAFYGSLINLLPEEVQQLEVLGARSILCVPIHLGEKWWGEIRLQDARELRDWSPAEIDGLRIVAGVLGAAIQRLLSDQSRRENEALYRRTISAAGAVPYIDHYTTDSFTFMGEGILDLTGYSSAEMTPAIWRSLVRTSVPMGEAAGLGAADALTLGRKGKLDTWRCDYHIRIRDGSMRWVSDTAVEMTEPDGSSVGSMGILMDITARREAEEAVRNLNAELERRVQERTAELQTANRELETFAYSVAHDLRAPLRSIDGYSKLLQEDCRAALPDEASFYLENVRQAAQRMGQLIDDLLRLSRVTRTEMHRTHVDLSQIAGQVVELLRRQEPQRQVEVMIEDNLWVQGDANLLRLVLENLLGNAWKFTSHTVQARIEMGTLQPGERVFFIYDNGAGFDMRYAHQLFKPFQRLHGGQDFEGSGVGLATVQRIIQRHGGRIWAKGVVGEGATFYFTLN